LLCQASSQTCISDMNLSRLGRIDFAHTGVFVFTYDGYGRDERAESFRSVEPAYFQYGG
jgi:hypothetical protein